jgi:hypothetical protein
VSQFNTALLGVRIKQHVLEIDVRDDRFIRIIEDIASLIATSEAACAEAMQRGNDDYADAVITTETDYLEDLIGTIFLMLQTKIRRVGQSAADLSKMLEASYGQAVKIWADPRAVRAEGGDYKNTGNSLVELIWAVGNYFKHRDEWSHDVWTSQGNGMDVKTRKLVQAAGAVESSSGNMRAALEFFGVDPYSSCGKLAQDVQNWANAILRDAEAGVQKVQPMPSKMFGKP